MSIIYVIQAGEDGPIKIGTTKHLAKRLASLQVGCPASLQVLATFPGSHQLERHLHRCLANWRLEGEWFSYCEDALAALTKARTDVLSFQDDHRLKEIKELRAAGWTLKNIGDALGISGERIRQIILAGEGLPINPKVDREAQKKGSTMSNHKSGVDKAISAAGSGEKLAEFLDVSPTMVTKYKRQGHFPLPKARKVYETYDIPMIELVAPDVRAAMLLG